jgi:putative transposase
MLVLASKGFGRLCSNANEYVFGGGRTPTAGSIVWNCRIIKAHEREFRVDEFESLNHTKWDCQYHVVFILKCRSRVLYGELRKHLGEVFRQLALQKESRIKEGHLLSDDVHMLIAIPPKYAVSQVIGFIKGKSAIHLARVYGRGSATLWVRVFGPEGTSSRRWVGTRR